MESLFFYSPIPLHGCPLDEFYSPIQQSHK
jgi:hypothetical protein